MVEKAKIMDEAAISRAMARLTHEILERNQSLENLCVLGIKRRGVPLGKMLCDNMKRFWDADVPFGILDVTNHRDDLSDQAKQKNAGQSEFPCDITGKTVILVDDVLFTGRTTRAAIETVFASGRPKSVQFLALVDRGHRELPIRPDYVGKNIPTSKTETVKVFVEEIDGKTGVYIYTQEA